MNDTTPLAPANAKRVLALCGGIGGAKLALGLYKNPATAHLSIVVNTGDDFEHLGLKISPDLDTVLYTLGGLADPERGWGRSGETWNFMASLRQMGGETWFQLGDCDMAMHVERTRLLHGGMTLSSFSDRMARALGIDASIVPMSDNEVATMIDTDEGVLPFQHYFVKRQCEPRVHRIWFSGRKDARPSETLLRSLQFDPPDVIIVCPSNPYLSVDPILSIPGMIDALRATGAPLIAVSPIVGGQALKGPTTKIMHELGLRTDNPAIVWHYSAIIDGIVIDRIDAPDADSLNIPVCTTNTVMKDLDDRINLASECMAFAERLTPTRPQLAMYGGFS